MSYSSPPLQFLHYLWSHYNVGVKYCMISKMSWWDYMSIRLLKASCSCKTPIEPISSEMQHCWTHSNNTSLPQEPHQPLQLNIITVFQVTELHRARSWHHCSLHCRILVPPSHWGRISHAIFLLQRVLEEDNNWISRNTCARNCAVIRLTHNSSKYLRNTSAGLCTIV